MNATRNGHTQNRRSDDSFFKKYLTPILLTMSTSGMGGATGALVTIQLHEYRLTRLEQHEKADEARFEHERERAAQLTAEIAAMKERHKLEDVLIVPRPAPK